MKSEMPGPGNEQEAPTNRRLEEAHRRFRERMAFIDGPRSPSPSTPTERPMTDNPEPAPDVDSKVALFWDLMREVGARDFPMELVIWPETARALLAERAQTSPTGGTKEGT